MLLVINFLNIYFVVFFIYFSLKTGHLLKYKALILFVSVWQEKCCFYIVSQVRHTLDFGLGFCESIWTINIIFVCCLKGDDYVLSESELL